MTEMSISDLERKMLSCDKHCANHSETVDKIDHITHCVSKIKDHTPRIISLEKRINIHDKHLDNISTKLNLIIGGIILSPFLVALITLLIKSNRLF